jgi:multidrug efflux system outer membrane protein
VLAADAACKATRAELANLTRQLAAAENALRLLVGSSPSCPWAPMLEQQAPGGRCAGRPACRGPAARPDVLAAEQRLIAANANIGAARAAFLPRILLTAALGTASRALSGLFDAGSGAWSFATRCCAIRCSMPAAAPGNSDLAEARKTVAVADYEKTLQQAFREIADLLAAREQYAEQLPRRTRRPRRRANASALSRRATTPACPATSNCSTRSANYFAAQQSALAIRRLQLANTASLYKALAAAV